MSPRLASLSPRSLPSTSRRWRAKVAAGERAERTIELYRSYFANHIGPELGRVQIQAVSVARIDRFISALRRKPRAPKSSETLSAWTVHNVCGMLSKLFRYAHKRGYIAVNPLDRIRDDLPAGKNKQPPRVLEADEVRRLIDHTPAGYRAIVATAAYTGMRISEVLGLTWEDVDFESGEVHVRKQLGRGKKGEPAKRTSLKTDAAKRTIDLAPQLETMLRNHRATAFERGQARRDCLVFATLTGAPINHRNASARGLEKAADRAGLNREGLPRLGFHDLRHTAITHLIRSGADVAQVQRFAGHARPSITLDAYTHEFDRRRVNDSGRRLAAIYGEAR